MKKKSSTKAKKKTQKTTNSQPTVSAYKEVPTVRVEKIDNGFVVSKYGNTGEKKEFVKKKDGIGKTVNKMLK